MDRPAIRSMAAMVVLAIHILGSNSWAETSPAAGLEKTPRILSYKELEKYERCKAFAEANPDLKDLLHLKPDPLPESSTRGHARSCIKGGVDTVIDSIEVIPQIANAIVDQYDFLSKRKPAQLEADLKRCQKSNACVEKVYFDAYGVPPSDRQSRSLERDFSLLHNTYKKASFRQRSENRSAWMQEDQRAPTNDRIENEKWLNYKPSQGSAATDSAGNESAWFWETVRQSLHNYGEKWYCLKPEVATEFFCYNLTLIIGPIAAKGPVTALASKSTSVVRLLETRKLRKFKNWVGKSVKLDANGSLSDSIHVTQPLVSHTLNRHVSNNKIIERLVQDDVDQTVLYRAINSRVRPSTRDRFNRTTIYPQKIIDDVLSKSFANPKVISRQLDSSFGRNTEIVVLKQGEGQSRHEIQLRVCRSKKCSGPGGAEVFKDGDVTQVFIKCGPLGAILPPLDCFNLTGTSGLKMSAMRKCKDFVKSEIVEREGRYFSGPGSLKAVRTPACNP